MSDDNNKKESIAPNQNNRLEEGKAKGIPLKGFAWASLEWARSPYYYIVVIYIFATYFSDTVVGDSAKGQTIISLTITISGLVMALVAPILGSLMDRGGKKKPALIFIMWVIAFCSAGLYFVDKTAAYAIPLGMVLLGIAYSFYSLSELFHNALLSTVGRKTILPYVSGLGIAMGNTASVLVLLFALVLLESSWFGLSSEMISRLSGPFIAGWIVVFLLPFMVFMTEKEEPNKKWKLATQHFFEKGWKSNPVKVLKQHIERYPNVMRFIISRMLFADGLSALFTIGAVYVAGVLNWTTSEVAAMGIISTIFAILGGLISGPMDRHFGPKKSLTIELVSITFLFCLTLTITDSSLFFGLVDGSKIVWDGPIFNNLSDVVYITLMMPMAMFIVASYSTSRYMLIHISPSERIGEFFGLYALTGTATVWLGPAIVSAVTALSNNQRIGFTGLLLLFLSGLYLLRSVKEEPYQQENHQAHAQ